MRLIDADALMAEINEVLEHNKTLIDEWLSNIVTDAIDNAPTIEPSGDSIRCGDCKWYKICEYFDPHNASCRINQTHEIRTETHECVQETHDSDLISRAEAHKAICRLCSDYERCEYNIGKTCYRAREQNAIDKVPSVSAERVGEWIRVGHDIWECSICHQDVMTKDIECYNYCHRCGAEMKGGKE